MAKTAHIQLDDHNDERKIWRAENFDLCGGRINVPLMREANEDCVLLDYLQPNESSWTQSVREMGPGALAEGIYTRVSTEGHDGLWLDTPLDGVSSPWHGVDIAYSIRERFYFTGHRVFYNAGDFDSWQGRTEQWAAMYRLFSYHMVEVWLDLAKYDLQKFSQRTAAVNKAVAENKTLILGIYDQGGHRHRKAADIINGSPWGDKVYFLYKVSPSECALCPGVNR